MVNIQKAILIVSLLMHINLWIDATAVSCPIAECTSFKTFKGNKFADRFRHLSTNAHSPFIYCACKKLVSLSNSSSTEHKKCLTNKAGISYDGPALIKFFQLVQQAQEFNDIETLSNPLIYKINEILVCAQGKLSKEDLATARKIAKDCGWDNVNFNYETKKLTCPVKKCKRKLRGFSSLFRHLGSRKHAPYLSRSIYYQLISVKDAHQKEYDDKASIPAGPALIKFFQCVKEAQKKNKIQKLHFQMRTTINEIVLEAQDLMSNEYLEKVKKIVKDNGWSVDNNDHQPKSRASINEVNNQPTLLLSTTEEEFPPIQDQENQLPPAKRIKMDDNSSETSNFEWQKMLNLNYGDAHLLNEKN